MGSRWDQVRDELGEYTPLPALVFAGWALAAASWMIFDLFGQGEWLMDLTGLLTALVSVAALRILYVRRRR